MNDTVRIRKRTAKTSFWIAALATNVVAHQDLATKLMNKRLPKAFR